MSACYSITPQYPQPTSFSGDLTPAPKKTEFNMAEKEATVYIVDMGISMGEKRNARKESDLDWAMTYVWEKITGTVGTWKSSPHDLV